MMDEVEEQGKKIDVLRIVRCFARTVIAGVAVHGQGIEELKELISVGVAPVDRRSWRMPEQVSRASKN